MNAYAARNFPYACFIACQDSRWFALIGTASFQLIFMSLVSRPFASLEELEINLQLRFPGCSVKTDKNIAQKTGLARVHEAYEIIGISQNTLEKHLLDDERLV